jgi:hypothetical protein
MTDIPQAAPRSEDGQWWWDGAQWQPVAGAAGPAAAAAPSGTTQDAAPAAAAAAASGATQDPAPAAAAAVAGGQLSEDGQWQWDGSAWQPAAQGGAPAGAAAQAADPASGAIAPAAGTAPGAAASPGNMGDVNLTIAVPTSEPFTMADGTTGLVVMYSVTNAGASPIAAGTLIPKVLAASDHSAEAVASVDGSPFGAFGSGEEHNDTVSIQLDPGTWLLFVQVVNANGDSMGLSESATTTVAGQVAAQRAFDDTQTYALSVTIEQVEHLNDTLFRVHYILQNNSERELPAGMRVSGELGGEASTQYYQMTSGLPAHQSHQHYLTLEAQYPTNVSATITVDKEGPSQAIDTVQVDIADDGTPTMQR